jgi:hypothetical protein
MDNQGDERQCLLRRALLGNAIFSTLSGITILAANHSIVRLLGLPASIRLTMLGICLLVFAAWLSTNAGRREMKTFDARLAVVMDLAWAVGSFVLLFVAPFSTQGKWIVAVIADVVLCFAILQWLGIRKIRKSTQFSST